MLTGADPRRRSESRKFECKNCHHNGDDHQSNEPIMTEQSAAAAAAAWQKIILQNHAEPD